MTTHKDTLKLALEALSKSDDFLFDWHENESDNEADAYATTRQLNEKAITAIKEALAQPEQEPVAFITPLMEQQMFDDWCPYKGSPDPRVVWAAAIDAVNGLLLGATTPPPVTESHKRKPDHTEDNLEMVEKQEPVAWITQGGKGWLRWHKSYDDNKDSVPLYTTPPQRTWAGLTEDERTAIRAGVQTYLDMTQYEYGKAVQQATELKLQEKNA